LNGKRPAGNTRVFSLNSCLCPIGSLDGAAVTTAEGLGNSQVGFHPIQGMPLTL